MRSLLLLLVALVAVYAYEVHKGTITLERSEWRCVVRDVESGTCDVYERIARDRGTP